MVTNINEVVNSALTLKIKASHSDGFLCHTSVDFKVSWNRCCSSSRCDSMINYHQTENKNRRELIFNERGVNVLYPDPQLCVSARRSDIFLFDKYPLNRHLSLLNYTFVRTHLAMVTLIVVQIELFILISSNTFNLSGERLSWKKSSDRKS